MNAQEHTALLDRLRREPHETEWLEFKENHYEPQVLGEYLSALANAACLAGKPRGYLVFGVQDQTHAVVGTQFDPYAVKAKGNQDLLMWLAMGLQPNVGFEVHVLAHPKGRVVFFEVGPAWDWPVRFYGTAFIRVGTSKTALHKHPETERAIWSRRTDWSGHVCEGSALADLDQAALLKAREQFRIKHPKRADEVEGWDDTTFLNKAKLTVRGADLDLWKVILLDRVQKRLSITHDAHRVLKSAGLVEGRYPNLFIAASVAKLTGQKARHIRERGFNEQYYLDAIEALIREHQPLPRSEIDRLLLDKLPEVLNEKQKKAKVHNLMAELARKGRIENRGSRGHPAWHTVDKPLV
jgi:ATP-dependent DNA helicase RecG